MVLESVVAPLAAYYFVLLIAGFRGALIGALVWSYLIVARRLMRHERVSTLLLLGTVLLTMRTVISFVTGSLFLYFIQPTASTFLASLALVGSALLGRPFTQRFTHDFCPLTPELLARPTVHRFFVRVSFLWAVAMFVNGGVVLWLLLTASAGALSPRAGGHHPVAHGRGDLLLHHMVHPQHAARRRDRPLRWARFARRGTTSVS